MKITMNTLTTPQEIEVFPHGKYSGQKVIDVFAEDAAYVLWWCETVEQYPLKSEIAEACISSAFQAEVRKNLGPNIWCGAFDPWDFGDR